MSTPKKENKRASKPGGSPPQAKAKAEKSSAVAVVDDDEDDTIVVQANAPPLWFVAYEERLEKHLSSKFGDLAVKLDDVKALAQNAKNESRAAIEIAKAKDTQMKQLQVEMGEIRKRLDAPDSNIGNASRNTSRNDDMEMREFEIIAHGFEKNTDAADVEHVLNNLIKDMKFEDRVSKVCTFSDPSSIGVIRFRTVPSKYGFYKKLMNHSAKSKGGNILTFENNQTLEERAEDEHQGYTKHLLSDQGKAKPESVQIRWRQRSVEVDGVPVAWLNSAGKFEVSGMAEERSNRRLQKW